MKTARWKQRSRKRIVKDCKFGGTSLGISGVEFKELPVSLEFTVDGDEAEFKNRETIFFAFTIEEAESLQRALGDSILFRKKQIGYDPLKKEKP